MKWPLNLALLGVVFYAFMSCSSPNSKELVQNQSQKNDDAIDTASTSLESYDDSFPELQEGDIIFHTSTSSQSKAIQLATGSEYSHVGIVLRKEGELMVFEAVQPVKFTSVTDWMARGENGHYVVKRLKGAETMLIQSSLDSMKQMALGFEGLNYDLFFEWSDEKLYCSELVWKMYHQVLGIELGAQQRLSDFDLSHALVQEKMQQRYGTEIPMDEKVISPAAIFNSKDLVTVLVN